MIVVAVEVPTGKCIGWHNLSEEEYQEKLTEYEEANKDMD